MADSATRVWDLPTRLFHWSLALLIFVSWRTAESGALDWHYRSGLLIIGLITFRLLWGVMGSSTARFANFVKGPAAIIAYLKGGGAEQAGHNPLGALSVIALLGLVTLQLLLGLFAVDNDGLFEGPLAHFVSLDMADKLTDLHEDMFNVLGAFIILHIAAVIIYAFKGRKLIGPMVTGKDSQLTGVAAMEPAKAGRAIICGLVSVAVMTLVYWLGTA